MGQPDNAEVRGISSRGLCARTTTLLRQHLSERHALFLATEKDEKRSLVFLNDEFQTGTGFPRGIEDLVEAAVERARTSRSPAG